MRIGTKFTINSFWLLLLLNTFLKVMKNNILFCSWFCVQAFGKGLAWQFLFGSRLGWVRSHLRVQWGILDGSLTSPQSMPVLNCCNMYVHSPISYTMMTFFRVSVPSGGTDVAWGKPHNFSSSAFCWQQQTTNASPNSKRGETDPLPIPPTSGCEKC